MSFFDEDDVPTRRRTPPRPRRSAPAGPRAGDQQTLLVRRAVAIGAAVVFILLLLVGINSCRSNAKENALKDYNREVASIGRDSETQVGRPFFQLLSGEAAGSPTDLQTSVNSLRVEAERHLTRAEDLSVPDEMVAAQRSLLIALEFRRDGLDFIGQQIRVALGDEGDPAEEATAEIAGQMQAFLASDVLYDARVRPFITRTLADAEIGGQETPQSRFMPDVAWLSPGTVADRLGSGGGGGGDTGGSDDEPAPGLHGTGLGTVSVGDTTLSPDAPNRIAAGGPPTFNVQFANQGENDEQDVRVDVTVSAGGRTIRGSDTVDSIARGATATATVRLPRTPPTGTAVTIAVRVRAVPGEEMTDNNEQEYQALFTG